MKHRTAVAGAGVIVVLVILVLVPMPFYHQDVICASYPSAATVHACQFGYYHSFTAQNCLGYGGILGLGVYEFAQTKCTSNSYFWDTVWTIKF
jgi:hypothetical protein